MRKRLLAEAIAKFAAGLLIIALLLFVPAGTLRYMNAWLLMGALFIPILLMGVALYIRSPELLRKRLSDKEREREQSVVVALSAVMFIAGFVLSGLDFRFGWSHMPLWAVIAAVCVFLAGYALFAEVVRENAYLSRTVEVQHGQKVVDTGVYGIVRHPMYFATVLMFWAMPLVLGSLIAFLAFLPYPLLLVKRIKNEEAVLASGLSGYTEYMRRVKYRLIPYIW